MICWVFGHTITQWRDHSRDIFECHCGQFKATGLDIARAYPPHPGTRQWVKLLRKVGL